MVKEYSENRFTLAANLYILLFSFGFFLYNFFLGQSYITDIFGGFCSWLSLVFLLYVFAQYIILGPFRICITKLSLLLIIFSVIIFIMSFIYFLLEYPNVSFYKAFFYSNCKFLLNFWALFIAAYNFNVYKMQYAIYLSFFLVVAIILSTTDWSVYTFAYTDNFHIDGLSTYQGMARSFFVLSVLAVWSVHDKLLKIFLMLLSVFLFFLIGSRTEFLISLIALLLLVFRHYKNCIWLLFLIVIVFAVMVFIFQDGALSNNRMAALILNFSTDASFLERQQMFAAGIEDIMMHPILGSYGGEVKYFGRMGTYIHGILSLWRQFGIIPFLIYIYIIFYALLLQIRQIKVSNDVYTNIGLTMLVPLIIALIFSKHYSFFEIALPLSLIAAFPKFHKRCAESC